MAVRLHGPLRVFLLTTITIYRHEKRTNAFRVVTITTVTTARVLLTPKQVFDDVNGGRGEGCGLIMTVNDVRYYSHFATDPLHDVPAGFALRARSQSVPRPDRA